MARVLSGKVCLVTGASRGIGKGIAIQLAESGAKVYITGRTLDPIKGSKGKGSLRETTDEINASRGTCIPVLCDHSKDDDVKRLFEQIARENDGQLDVLVNNAYSAVKALFDQVDQPFWDHDPSSSWDDFNNVGLRNYYICSTYAARMMVPRKSGLILNLSSYGGLKYSLNVLYGIGKESCDRMAADCGFELKQHNVAFVSLWPNAVNGTEAIDKFHDYFVKNNMNAEIFKICETPDFVGKCVVALAADPDVMGKSGKIAMTYDLAREYEIKDKTGHVPIDFMQAKSLFQYFGYLRTAKFFPNFVRLPKWVLPLMANKFY